ncbi:hypothetical protein [Tunturibacter empetritectus]|uniref:Uncharacterized protein n=1 Tax=Tunturiibacter empetritectus TaxID=3069691 RepID=A0A7W8MUM5_9BACT|nr:hypothetical protein [Edaphobacter lichenicola]MBB5319454.1 hypothetical protein [Edaphobacter lichenicola]
MNDFLLEAFPNPERKGCPDESTLKALAENRLPLEDPAGLHLASCSECYGEYRHYRLDWKEAKEAESASVTSVSGSNDAKSSAIHLAAKRPSSRYKGSFLAVAASVLVICGAAIAYRYQHQTSTAPVQIASTAPVDAKVDLFNAPTLRGVDDDAAPLQEVSLPAAIVHLSVTLPRFSQSGQYEVVVSQDRGGSQRVAKGFGTAVDSNGKVGMDVTLDLRAAKAGSYFLSTVRGSDNGTYYYPLQVK